MLSRMCIPVRTPRSLCRTRKGSLQPLLLWSCVLPVRLFWFLVLAKCSCVFLQVFFTELSSAEARIWHQFLEGQWWDLALVNRSQLLQLNLSLLSRGGKSFLKAMHKKELINYDRDVTLIFRKLSTILVVSRMDRCYNTIYIRMGFEPMLASHDLT